MDLILVSGVGEEFRRYVCKCCGVDDRGDSVLDSFREKTALVVVWATSGGESLTVTLGGVGERDT